MKGGTHMTDTITQAVQASGVEHAEVNEIASLYRNLTRVSRTLRSIASGSLTAGTASALWTVIQSSPIRLCELADRESVTAPTMSRIVAGLEDAGYIERQVDPDDARARLFSATPAGIELITNAQSVKARVLTDALAGLDASDRETVFQGLELLADALHDHAQT